MEFSFLKDIAGESALTAYLENRTYPERYFERALPYQNHPQLNFIALLGEHKNIAADVVAYNSSAPEKTRRILSRLTGEIPAIRIKRIMRETDLNTLLMYQAFSDKFRDKKGIYDLLFNDVDFTYEAVINRLNWLACKALSYGEVALTKSVNAGIVTQSNIDYQIPASHKSGVSVVWSAASNTTKCITDITAICTAAQALGVTLKYMLMSSTSFTQLRSSDETKNFVFGRNVAAPAKRPNLGELNTELQADALPTVVIMNDYVDLEDEEHTITNALCWTQGYITFLPELPIGKTYVGPLAAEILKAPKAIQQRKGPVLVEKWSENDPTTEYTLGECNAFSVIEAINSIFMLNSLNVTTWS